MAAEKISKMYRDLVMVGITGATHYVAPQGTAYVSIINNSDNLINVYQDHRRVEDDHIKEVLVQVQNYSSLTVPVNEGDQFTFIHHNGSDTVGVQKATLIFSNVNLNINGILGNPLVSTSVNLASDSIGLTRKNQLPDSLTPAGNLRVEVQNEPSVTVKPDPEKPLAVTVSQEVEVKNDVGNPLRVYQVPDQYTGIDTREVSVSTTAAALPGASVPKDLLIVSHSDNTEDIFIGGPTGQHFTLKPGAGLTLEIDNPAKIYARAASDTQKIMLMWGLK